MIKPFRNFVLLILSIGCFLVCGCGEMGNVDQGRTIDFNKETKVVTIIRDTGKTQGSPDYSVLPPVTYELPKFAEETGTEPKVGMRMKLDTAKRQIVIYDPNSKTLIPINYELVEQRENVQSYDPILIDAKTGKNKQFPIIDKEQKIITVYSKRQQILTAFKVPDEYFTLPDNTWDSGDEVRIYYKEPGKALRFMNVSKTDIYKK